MMPSFKIHAAFIVLSTWWLGINLKFGSSAPHARLPLQFYRSSLSANFGRIGSTNDRHKGAAFWADLDRVGRWLRADRQTASPLGLRLENNAAPSSGAFVLLVE